MLGAGVGWCRVHGVLPVNGWARRVGWEPFFTGSHGWEGPGDEKVSGWWSAWEIGLGVAWGGACIIINHLCGGDRIKHADPPLWRIAASKHLGPVKKHPKTQGQPGKHYDDGHDHGQVRLVSVAAVRQVRGPDSRPLAVGALGGQEQAPAAVPALGAVLGRVEVRAEEAFGRKAGWGGGGGHYCLMSAGRDPLY